jgi:hypothetical protein
VIARGIALALSLLSFGAFADDQVWRWVDEKGEEHYTNDKSSIPEKSRPKATSTTGAELSVLQTAGGPLPNEPARPATKAMAPAAAAAVNRVLVFEASTNAASKALKKSGALEQLVSENPGLKLERYEFAAAVERAEALHVTEIPTVLFLDDTGVERGRATGSLTIKQLQFQLDLARGMAR